MELLAKHMKHNVTKKIWSPKFWWKKFRIGIVNSPHNSIIH